MFDMEIKNSSITKSVNRMNSQVPIQIAQINNGAASPTKQYDNGPRLYTGFGKDSTVPSTIGNNGIRSTLSVKSHVIQYMANTDKLYSKIK